MHFRVVASCVQAMSRRGVEVAYVGNSSSILAVGGLCPRWGNAALWDTLAPVSAGPVARLLHHSPLVTALQVGFWQFIHFLPDSHLAVLR